MGGSRIKRKLVLVTEALVRLSLVLIFLGEKWQLAWTGGGSGLSA